MHRHSRSARRGACSAGRVTGRPRFPPGERRWESGANSEAAGRGRHSHLATEQSARAACTRGARLGGLPWERRMPKNRGGNAPRSCRAFFFGRDGAGACASDDTARRANSGAEEGASGSQSSSGLARRSRPSLEDARQRGGQRQCRGQWRGRRVLDIERNRVPRARLPSTGGRHYSLAVGAEWWAAYAEATQTCN